MKDEVLMKIKEKEVDIFCEIYPSLADFVVMENRQKVLYIQINKALYRCVQSVLFWYEIYVFTLKNLGFELNP